MGTANHSLAVAWTAKFSTDTGVKARVKPSPNGYSRSAWLAEGEGRLALSQASTYFDKMDAALGFASPAAGPSDTRLFGISAISAWGYVVRGNSDIKSLDDIGPGTRIAYAESTPFLAAGIDALLAYRGLEKSDVSLIEVGSYSANTTVLTEERADVTFTGPLSGINYQAEATPGGIRWLPLPERSDNPEAYDRYRKILPGYSPGINQTGTESSIGILLDHSFQDYHVRGDEDEEFVYQLYKWTVEHHDEYKDDYVHAKMMSLENLVKYLDQGALEPLADGTIRYLKEVDLWKPEYQARQDALIALAERQVEAFRAAVDEARERGITVQQGDQEWIDLWKEYRVSHDIPLSFGNAVRALD
ncbi:hypothetical protein A3721_06410 [Sulfitobacter sp. HI0023]|nr:hypothetical protein A3721_06410 [Sulfitobacter sp. HI0023]